MKQRAGLRARPLLSRSLQLGARPGKRTSDSQSGAQALREKADM